MTFTYGLWGEMPPAPKGGPELQLELVVNGVSPGKSPVRFPVGFHFDDYSVSQDLRSNWAAVSHFGSHALVSYHCRAMKWKKLFGTRPKRLPVWAALCIGRADGSNPKYLA